MQWGRLNFSFSRSQVCSNYHKEMLAFLWVGVISLHRKQPLIHCKPAAWTVWTSKYIIMKKEGLGFSLSRWQGCSNNDMEMLAFLWMGQNFSHADSRQPLIYFKHAAWFEITSNCITMMWGRSGSSFLRSYSSPQGLSKHPNVTSCMQ